MTNKISMILVMLVLIGCKSPAPLVTDFPTKPELTKYSQGPIIKKIGSNFEVVPELISNSVMLTDYSKRIDQWKLEKNIR